MSVTVRLMTAKDYEAAAPMLCGIQNVHAKSRPDQFVICNEFSREKFEKTLAESYAFLAEADGKPAGYCIMTEKHFDGKEGITVPHSLAFVEDLFVKSEFRRQGIGELLMKTMQDKAKERKLEHFELKVWCFNKGAIHLYEELGFRPKYLCMELPDGLAEE